MPINSRQKGARGERLLRDVFIEHGFPARRGQQFSGSPDSPDVVVPDLAWLHIECKFVEDLNVHKAVEQAQRDAGEDKTPVVFHKQKGKEWIVILTQEDFFELITKIHDLQQKENGNTNHTNYKEVSDDKARKPAPDVGLIGNSS